MKSHHDPIYTESAILALLAQNNSFASPRMDTQREASASGSALEPILVRLESAAALSEFSEKHRMLRWYGNS